MRLLINSLLAGIVLVLPAAYILPPTVRAFSWLVVLLVALLLNHRSMFMLLDVRNSLPRKAWIMMPIYMVLILILLRLITSAWQYSELGDTQFGVTNSMALFLQGIVFLAIFSWLRETSAATVTLVLAAGFAGYCAINMLGSFLGLENPNAEIAGTVIGDTSVKRLLPPFARSVTNFGAYGALAMAIGVIGFGVAKTSMRLWRSCGLIVAVLIGATSCWLAQVRFSFVVLLFSLIWLVARLNKIRITLSIIAFVAMLSVPLLCLNLFYSDYIYPYLPNTVVENISRTNRDSEFLGGRVLIYNYGFERLLAGEVGWFGEGPIIRDASPAVVGYVDYEVTKGEGLGSGWSYHNGFMETLVCHGPLITTLVFGSLVSFLLGSRHKLRKTSQIDECDEITKMLSLTAGFLGTCFVAGTFEVIFNETYALYIIVGLLWLSGSKMTQSLQDAEMISRK